MVPTIIYFSYVQLSNGFMEEILNQFGGMDDSMHGRRAQATSYPKWPKNVKKTIDEKFNVFKGTEWQYNDRLKLKLKKDGTIEINCQSNRCRMDAEACDEGHCNWSAHDDKLYFQVGEDGVSEFTIVGGGGKPPKEQNKPSFNNLKLQGTMIQKNNKKSKCTFSRIYDFEAMLPEFDPYSILDVTDEATEQQIKSAFRKYSLKYHPDKNPDEESRRKYEGVRQAYDILSDAKKRIMFDMGGMDSIRDMEKGNMNELRDTESKLEVTLADLYKGIQKSASIRRRVVCRGCGKNPNLPRCDSCNRCPNEVKLVQRQMGHMIIQQQEEVPSKEKCKYEKKEFDLQVERGMKEGEMITFANAGEQKPGYVPGDVIYKLKTKKDDKFTRYANDLHVQMTITLKEALLGFSKTLKHLDGHIVKISSDQITKPNHIFVIEGEGMPVREDPSEFGKLRVIISVDFPNALTSGQKEVIAAWEGKQHASRDEL